MTTLAMPLSIPFDILGYFERLKDAGVPEKQAKVQTEVLQQAFQAYEEGVRKVFATETSSMRADLRDELATKGDVRETELRLQKEIEVVRKEIEVVRKEIVQSKHEMIKWYVGISIAQLGVFVGILAAFYAIIR